MMAHEKIGNQAMFSEFPLWQIAAFLKRQLNTRGGHFGDSYELLLTILNHHFEKKGRRNTQFKVPFLL